MRAAALALALLATPVSAGAEPPGPGTWRGTVWEIHAPHLQATAAVRLEVRPDGTWRQVWRRAGGGTARGASCSSPGTPATRASPCAAPGTPSTA
jgi:hypothetical protein